MELPLPPEEMRALVGPTDTAAFDNPNRALVYRDLAGVTGDVFDFGCGCGRLARQLIQQRPQPRSYVGVDLHAGMVRWCQTNLAPLAPQFRFEHHDIFNAGFNPHGKPSHTDLPVDDASFDLHTHRRGLRNALSQRVRQDSQTRWGPRFDMVSLRQARICHDAELSERSLHQSN